MKRRIITVINYMLLLCIMLSSAPLFSAQESASSVAQKEERSQLQRIYNWLFEKYGMPQEDWKIIKKWLIKKWRRQEIEPELDKKANSIFKKYIIPAVVIAAFAAGTGVWWWRKKRIERESQLLREGIREEEKAAQAKREKGLQLLMESVAGGDEATVTRLLDARVAVNEQDTYGNTALIWATRTANENMVDLLLSRGANVNVQNRHGSTPLMEAITKKNEKLVDTFLQRGADVNAQDKDGITALHEAVLKGSLKGYLKIVNALLDKGANINAQDKRGYTPLLYAARNGNEEMAELLLNRGADINAQDEEGYTALLYAVRNDDEEMVDLLLERGADPTKTIAIAPLLPLVPIITGYSRRKEAEAFLFERAEPSYVSRVPLEVQKHIASYILGREYTPEHKEKYERRKQKAEERKKAAQKELPTSQEGKEEEE